MSKARDLADSAQEINILDGKSFLDEDNLASDSATGIASQQSIKAYVDGITTTNITSTGALNSGSITSGFGNIDNGSSTITTTGAITGGSFVIGSADINENDLESIDGITAGTVAASKAVVVNANKDITGFRNLTATGTISGTLSGTLSGSLSSTTTATTQAESDDSTKIATTAYVVDKITTLIGGAPSTLNDLNELAAAINDDANYNSTLTTALATKLPLAGGTLTGDVTFGDNDKAIFGAGSDLQIYHSGTHSIIKDAGSGNLQINAGDFVVNNTPDTKAILRGFDGGAVTAYFDGSAKLATTSTGIQVTGNIANASGDLTLDVAGDINLDAGGTDIYLKTGGTAWGHLWSGSNNFYINSTISDGDIIFQGVDGGSGITALTLDMSDAGTAIFNHDVKLGDLQKAYFGDSNDLEIFHNGTDNYIKNATSDQDLIIQGNDGGNIINALTFDMSDGGKATFNNGLIANGDISLGDSKYLLLGNANDFQIFHNGADSYLFDNGTGNLNLTTNGASINLKKHSGGENMLVAVPDGSVSLYHNNSKKIETTSSGVTVTGTVAATSYTGDGSNLTGISSGAITALGSANIVGTANSVSISNLDLTDYKQLIVLGRFIQVTGGGWLGLQSGANANGMIQMNSANQSDVGTSFIITCDLTTGVAQSTVSKPEKYENGAYVNNATAFGLERGGAMLKPGITNSTTTVSLHPRSGSYTFGFSSGNVGVPRAMYLYGVA